MVAVGRGRLQVAPTGNDGPIVHRGAPQVENACVELVGVPVGLLGTRHEGVHIGQPHLHDDHGLSILPAPEVVRLQPRDLRRVAVADGLLDRGLHATLPAEAGRVGMTFAVDAPPLLLAVQDDGARLGIALLVSLLEGAPLVVPHLGAHLPERPNPHHRADDHDGGGDLTSSYAHGPRPRRRSTPVGIPWHLLTPRGSHGLSSGVTDLRTFC